MSGVFGSNVIEVAIGLFFAYLLLSLLCSNLNEMLAGIMRWRAKTLEEGIKRLLHDGKLIQEVLDHPLITSISNPKDKNKQSKLPSYIEAQTFTLALFNSLVPSTSGPATFDRIHDRALDMAKADDVATQKLGRTLLSLLDESQDPEKILISANAMITKARNLLTYGDLKDPHLQALKDAMQQPLSRIRDAIKALPESANRTAMSDFISATTLTVAGLLKFVEALDLPEADNKAQIVAAIDPQASLEDVRAAIEALPDSIVQKPILLELTSTAQISAASAITLMNLVRGLQSPDKDKLLAAINPIEIFEDFRNAITLLPESGLRTELLTFISSGRADLAAARQSVETWYNNAMDRVSGVYKRQVQVWLYGIAVGVTLLTGADTFKIAQTLTNNSTLRSLVVNQATRQVAAGAPATSTAPISVTAQISDTKALLDQLGTLSDLIGYGDAITLANTNWKDVGGLGSLKWFEWVLLKLVGLAFTALAVAQGAPFWFDMLQKVVNVRAAGKRPDTSPPKQKSPS